MSQPQQEPVINNQEVALRIIIQGVNLAQNRGCYNLQEAEILSKCIKMFKKPQEVVQPPPEEAEKKEEVEVENIAI